MSLNARTRLDGVAASARRLVSTVGRLLLVSVLAYLAARLGATTGADPSLSYAAVDAVIPAGLLSYAWAKGGRSHRTELFRAAVVMCGVISVPYATALVLKVATETTALAESTAVLLVWAAVVVSGTVLYQFIQNSVPYLTAYAEDTEE